ncbi:MULTISPECIES: cysteine-rich CWC family protein [Sulfurospirillum]|uniref:Cysteine-rich CWC protein n=4 Tax=Sulfurospirillum TaxID=57665 RepID=A0A1D7TJZ7_9BACT|nr:MULTISPECIES: cysteine-rich CWC family protein [Sulfurospirillum]AHJ12827.1 cysteine-rich CWC protein [Sulfurospirillum multivorans DSM 12446]AOO65306.1 cysteine-rich CWC protein [Sulfurospirillum halorespirans DSM 13726]QEI22760.1 cysteine-rich CWC protein [Sulfurospirillum multivorans]QIR74725.1 cysteine-rich CWC family protein [Sulfurospirillum diekertiae]QIR77399.1 cysteine-rich CWC family protein [Sulfurospirillum diekertiae]
MNNKDEKICPLCGERNACQVGTSNQCWCHTIKVPQDLLDKIPQEKKGKACICYLCIKEYLQHQKIK